MTARHLMIVWEDCQSNHLRSPPRWQGNRSANSLQSMQCLLTPANCRAPSIVRLATKCPISICLCSSMMYIRPNTEKEEKNWKSFIRKVFAIKEKKTTLEKNTRKFYTVQVQTLSIQCQKCVRSLLNWWHRLDCEILRTCHSICILKILSNRTLLNGLCLSPVSTEYLVFHLPFFFVCITLRLMWRSMWITHWSRQSLAKVTTNRNLSLTLERRQKNDKKKR